MMTYVKPEIEKVVFSTEAIALGEGSGGSENYNSSLLGEDE